MVRSGAAVGFLGLADPAHRAHGERSGEHRGGVRRAIASVDATQPVIRVATMDQVIAQSTAQRRLAFVLFAAFAVAALLLSIAGIYGVLAGSVAERTREIGLRSALGATPREIVALVVRQGGALAIVGIVLGLGGAFALTRFLRTLLYGVGRATRLHSRRRWESSRSSHSPRARFRRYAPCESIRVRRSEMRTRH